MIVNEHIGSMLPTLPYNDTEDVDISTLNDDVIISILNNISEKDPDNVNINITEGTIMSESEDIFYNRIAFENGDINLCFITGYSGGGKSTLSRSESTKILREVVDMDRIILCTNKDDEYYKNLGKFADEYMNRGPGNKYREAWKNDEEIISKNINDTFRKSISKDMVKFAKKYANSHKSQKLILEGVWIYRYIEPSDLEDCAVYIKGTSLKTSTSRAIKRDNSSSDKSALKKFGYSVVKSYMAVKDIVTAHLNKYYKYFESKYKKQMEDDAIKYDKKMKNMVKNTISDLIHKPNKNIKENNDDYEYSYNIITEKFQDDILNAKTDEDVDRNIRKIIAKIYTLHVEIIKSELEETDDNKKSIEDKREYLKNKSELVKIKKTSSPSLRKSINEIEKLAKKLAEDEIEKIEKARETKKEKEKEEERINEGVAYDDIVDFYMTEMNHPASVISDISYSISQHNPLKKKQMVKVSDISKNDPEVINIINEYKQAIAETNNIFKKIYNVYKDTDINGDKLGNLIEIIPNTNNCSIFDNGGKYLVTLMSSIISYTPVLKTDKDNLPYFTKVLHVMRKMTHDIESENRNKLVKVSCSVFRRQSEQGRSVTITATIRTTIRKNIKNENTNESTRIFFSESDDGIIALSPELKRVDMKRGKLADLKRRKEEAEKQSAMTGEKIYENKIKGLTTQIDKLEKEIEDAEQKIKKEEEKIQKNKEKEKTTTESVITEAANMEEEIKPIVEELNSKGYKVKYASPGHKNLRKKEDSEPDGVYYGKLYSDARIMFDAKYKFPEAPEYWHWREVDGCSYLDISPKTYSKDKGDTPNEAFNKWKKAYMDSLRVYVHELPSLKSSSEDEDIKTESIEEIMESCWNDFMYDQGYYAIESKNKPQKIKNCNTINSILKEIDDLLM